MNKIEDLINELKFISTLKPVDDLEIVKEIDQKEMKLIIDLKQRIDKAIDYIDNHNKLEEELGGTILFNLVKLEKILKGGYKI